jgi:hypothetical protein
LSNHSFVVYCTCNTSYTDDRITAHARHPEQKSTTYIAGVVRYAELVVSDLAHAEQWFFFAPIRPSGETSGKLVDGGCYVVVAAFRYVALVIEDGKHTEETTG